MRGTLALLGLALCIAGAGCQTTEGQVFVQQPLPAEVPAPSPDPAGTNGGDPGMEPAADPLVEPPPDPALDAGEGATDPLVEPGLDPNIRFEWRQSLPGQGTCKAGRYVGSFECDVEGPFGPVRVDGSMTFTLTGSDEAQVLVLTDGLLSDFTGELFSAGLDGTLNCVDKLVVARTVDGRAKPMPVGVPPEWLAILPELGTFEATFGGSYDDQLLFMEGGMAMLNSLGESCTGRWRAGVVP